MGSRVNARFEHLFLAFENYCVRVNTDTPISQQPSCRSGTLVSGNIKIMRVFAGVPEKSNFNGNWVHPCIVRHGAPTLLAEEISDVLLSSFKSIT